MDEGLRCSHVASTYGWRVAVLDGGDGVLIGEGDPPPL